MGKSKRNSGPKQDSNRAAKLAQREAERASIESSSTRPFEGLAAECDLVALREFVPSATATAPITVDGRTITLATVLPGAVAALDAELEARSVRGRARPAAAPMRAGSPPRPRRMEAAMDRR